MADFAQAVTACETRFWPAGTFRRAYDVNRAEVVEALIETDPVGSALRLLMVRRQFWEGQASDLDGMLRAVTGHLEGAKNWPADPRILANTLRQLAPSLLKIGIDVRFHKSRDHDRKRLITVTANRPGAGINEAPVSASAASAPPEKTESGQKEGHNDAGRDDHACAISSTAPSPPTMSKPLAQTADAADAGEAEKSDLPKAFPPSLTPHAADAAGAGIKNQSVEFVSHRVIGGRRIQVLRHRRHGKAGKPSARRQPG